MMGVFAHPDDESLGMGGTFLHCAAQGVETFLVTATLGQAGRFRGHMQGTPEHPGPEALGKIRESELRAAAVKLGIREVTVLGYRDRELDQADPAEVIGRIATRLRSVRPQVVVTFAADGAYGHPDHVAISQLTTAAIVMAADPRHRVEERGTALEPHAVSKLYFQVWTAPMLHAYQAAFRRLVSTVDGVDREVTPWPEWMITTVIDTHAHWTKVWDAISCHQSQITAYEKLRDLSPEDHEGLWGRQFFYRVFSTVNGGRRKESDLFEGLNR